MRHLSHTGFPACLLGNSSSRSRLEKYQKPSPHIITLVPHCLRPISATRTGTDGKTSAYPENIQKYSQDIFRHNPRKILKIQNTVITFMEYHQIVSNYFPEQTLCGYFLISA
jgi:hypothetical protein